MSHCACLHFVVFRARPLIYLAECQHYCTIGEKLCSLHLMDETLNLPLIATFDVAGSNQIEFVKYDNGKVWINDTQYFNNVPPIRLGSLCWRLPARTPLVTETCRASSRFRRCKLVLTHLRNDLDRTENSWRAVNEPR